VLAERVVDLSGRASRLRCRRGGWSLEPEIPVANEPGFVGNCLGLLEVSHSGFGVLHKLSTLRTGRPNARRRKCPKAPTLSGANAKGANWPGGANAKGRELPDGANARQRTV